MRPLPRDYDADPSRFLSTDRHPHDDVHPYVAARFAAAGARTVLDVGGGHGRLTRLLPGLGLRALLVDLSAAMLDLAPRPAVRADGARLPAADASVDAVAALYTLYHYDDPLRPIREARRDGPLVTLGSAADAAAYLRVHRLEEKAAADAAAGLDLPMTLTMRGCVVYATKAAP